ncbi:MAG: hypothetical protein ABI743_12565, partial [bacterium]
MFGLLLCSCGGGSATTPAPDPLADEPFMLGWYDSVVTVPDYDRKAGEYRPRGFNTLLVTVGDLTERSTTVRYHIPWDDSDDRYTFDLMASRTTADYLRTKVAATGVRVYVEIPPSELFALSRERLGRAPVPSDWANIEEFVKALINDPSVSGKIAGWIAMDEPSLPQKRWATPSLIRELAVHLRALSNKPIALTFHSCIFQECADQYTGMVYPPLDAGRYRDAADLFLYDEYPFADATHADPAIPLQHFRDFRAMVSPQRVIFWAQAWGNSDFPDTPTQRDASPIDITKLRYPTPQEARFQAWSSLAAGSRGMLWFSLFWTPDARVQGTFSPIAHELDTLNRLLKLPNLLLTTEEGAFISPSHDCADDPRTCPDSQSRVVYDSSAGNAWILA